MDGTYKLTNRGYILIPFVLIDNHEKSRLGAWALVGTEEKEVLSEALTSFKEANYENIEEMEFVMLDKDFSEINALYAVLPHVHFIICSWHATRAVSRYVNSLSLDSNLQYLKGKVKNLFDVMMHAPSQDLYMKAWNEICQLSTINQTMDKCVEYLDNNWHQHRENFAKHCLKNKAILNSFTNNRSEAFNKHMKYLIPVHSRVDHVINTLLEYENEENFAQKKRDWENLNKVFVPKNVVDLHCDEVLKLSRDFLTSTKVKDLILQAKLMSKVRDNEVKLDKGQLQCPRISGPCQFSCTEIF